MFRPLSASFMETALLGHTNLNDDVTLEEYVLKLPDCSKVAAYLESESNEVPMKQVINNLLFTVTT